MSEGNDLAVKIGELIGASEKMNESIIVLHKKADQTTIQHTEMKTAISRIHDDFDGFKRELEPTIEGTKDYLENKKRVKYGVLGILTFGLLSGATIYDQLSKLKGIAIIGSIFGK